MPKNNPQPTADFWKRKIAAFLHDPPHKPLNIGKAHEQDAQSMLKSALPGFDDDWFVDLVHAVKDSDWTASAADRFCFPKGKAFSTFTGRPGSTFRHPLGGECEYEIDKLPEPGKALEYLQNAFGGIKVDEAVSDAEQWKQRFFLYWRRFLEQTVQQGGQALNMAYYPADTRIPDHTIWNHMNMASAFEGCRVDGVIKPASLTFQVGPVQDFIAASRSTRDLWSGSYLLAWLTANAIKAVTDTVGPDAVIFPALRGQGIFDSLHRRDMYSKITYKAGLEDNEDSLWHRMYGDDGVKSAKRLLSPTLPNRFVALVPESRVEELGQKAENALLKALDTLSSKCMDAFENLLGEVDCDWNPDFETRWQGQVKAFPQVTWTGTPWLHDIDAALEAFKALPVNQKKEGWTPHSILLENKRIAEAAGLSPNNSGFLWMLNYHRAEFAMAARRNTREFDQFVTDENQAGSPKDALTGKEEIIGDEAVWKALRESKDSPFKTNEGPYGAISIIKRLWYRDETDFFQEQLGIQKGILKKAMCLESVADVAAGNAGWTDEKDDDGEPKPKNPYVAILAMDGDEMGKWVSGEKNPALLRQVSDTARKYLEERGIKADLPRALTPSYHMQFSEALANVANYLAGPIVERYDGQLIYAGGDDVLAMLPATRALDCARALRAAFKGVASQFPEEQRNYELASTQEGFVIADGKYPLIVPGPKAEVSCGIAIAHYQHPLQAIVREAQKAEKRAKSEELYNRAAFAVSLMKRGGETIHWGSKWTSGALEVFDMYRGLRKAEKLSARFPYALAGLLAPYKLDEKTDQNFPTRQVVSRELEHVMDQQGNWRKEDKEEAGCQSVFVKACRNYLESLSESLFADFAKLFLTAAFIHRERAADIQKGGQD